jgi:hypothetical protein
LEWSSIPWILQLSSHRRPFHQTLHITRLKVPWHLSSANKLGLPLDYSQYSPSSLRGSITIIVEYPWWTVGSTADHTHKHWDQELGWF